MTREYEKALWMDRLERVQERIDSSGFSEGDPRSDLLVKEKERIVGIILAIDWEKALVAFRRRAARRIERLGVMA